jgi:hypothetical protein
MPMLIQTAATGGGVANYIEDVFSTYLFLGTQTTTTITNGIDLSGKGGLVWLKDRTGAGYHSLGDTARSGKRIYSNTTDAQTTNYPYVFTSTGVTLDGNLLDSGRNFVTWTFRKQPKFFDIVTWTGNATNRTIAHSLGSVPGSIIVKRTDTTADWAVYHRSLANTQYLVLNTTAAAATGATWWNSTTPTSSVFSVGTDASVNASAGTYVAYIFAHDAGGFGLSGADNVISCGSYTGNGTAGLAVTLGYEPQWVMIKCSSAALADGWIMADIMRGMDNNINKWLIANSANAESTESPRIVPTATGFTLSSNAAVNTSAATYIYIACRRGPMKVPTVGTSVYNAIARSGNSTSTSITGVGFVPDLTSVCARSTTSGFIWQDRLRAATYPMFPAITQLETLYANEVTAINQDGITVGTDTPVNQTGVTYINHFFGRAPGFFDEVCDTGTGTGHTISHNLGVVPQLMIRKRRNGASNWFVYPNDITQVLFLDATNPFGTNGATYWNSTSPTSSVFSIGTNTDVNTSGGTYVTYLFATCAGVSKVGSYTGTGTTQTINCGFTTGSRFVLIKRTDVAGDWYVWDSARGIVAGNDPYLLLNSVNAEVTSTDYVDTAATGFELSSTAPAALNANGGSYIFLAIA